MIDSSALLLTIIMTTPAEPLDTSYREHISMHTLDGVMQRLCWPHTAALSMQCDNAGVVKKRQDEKAQNLMKALNSIQQKTYSR